MRVFLSHAHNDAPLATAVKDLLVAVFGDAVNPRFSSRDIEPGMDWFRWIEDEVREAGCTIIVLTPESVNRPWLMWEAGAVSGITLTKGETTPLIPLLFRLPPERVPAPLARLQAIHGERREDVKRIVESLWRRVGSPPEEILAAALERSLPPYLDAIGRAIASRPLAVTEGAVEEWCERLDALRATRRLHQVDHLHRALKLAFGAADDDTTAPIDLRVHRRLGEIYLEARKPKQAVEQFDLAIRLAPRDIFLLHMRALAQTEAGNLSDAEDTLERIDALDAGSVTRNPEIAGLRGRINRQRWQTSGDPDDLQRARDAYWMAMEENADSYWMATNAAELSLALDRRDDAEDAMARAVKAIEKTGEKTVWSLSALAEAALVRGDEDEALEHLSGIARLDVTPRALESLRRGLARYRDRLESGNDAYARWLRALDEGQR